LIERPKAFSGELSQKCQLLFIGVRLLFQEPQTGAKDFASVRILSGFNLFFDKPVVVLSQVDVSGGHRLFLIVLLVDLQDITIGKNCQVSVTAEIQRSIFTRELSNKLRKRGPM
jgi:hypothetical protein